MQVGFSIAINVLEMAFPTVQNLGQKGNSGVFA
jgi:hypothetical protein